MIVSTNECFAPARNVPSAIFPTARPAKSTGHSWLGFPEMPKEYKAHGRNYDYSRLEREMSDDPDQMRLARERDWEVHAALVISAKVSTFEKIVEAVHNNPDVKKVLYAKFSPNRPLWVWDGEKPPFEHWRKKDSR